MEWTPTKRIVRSKGERSRDRGGLETKTPGVLDRVQGSKKGGRETKRTATEQCHDEEEDSDRGTKTKGTVIRGKIRGAVADKRR